MLIKLNERSNLLGLSLVKGASCALSAILYVPLFPVPVIPRFFPSLCVIKDDCH